MSLSGKCHTLTYEESLVLYGLTVGAPIEPDEREYAHSLLDKEFIKIIEVATEGRRPDYTLHSDPNSRQFIEHVVSIAGSAKLPIDGQIAYVTPSTKGKDCLSLPPEVEDCIVKNAFSDADESLQDAATLVMDNYIPDYSIHPWFQKCWAKIE